MVLTVLRALFVLLMAAVGWTFVKEQSQPFDKYTWLAMAAAVSIATLLVCVDILSPRRKLAIFSGVFFGLIVGIAFAYALSFVVTLLTDRYLVAPELSSPAAFDSWKKIHDIAISYIDLVLGVSCCYLSISFILQTKDDIRFVIPFVEFSKQTKGARPMILDTSVLIDGRINDIAATGILESQLLVPHFVLEELQKVADFGEKSTRGRGRYGLDVLKKLQENPSIDLTIYESGGDHGPVDQRLIELSKELNGRLLTNDFNLNKVAKVRGVSVINLNDLAGAMKPIVKVGERLRVLLQKPGDNPGQGVGYLQDGTMVVVEHGRPRVGDEVDVVVTNTRQTSAGRMIFGRLEEAAETKNPDGPRVAISSPARPADV
jgi:uncharacterized protein YacL